MSFLLKKKSKVGAMMKERIRYEPYVFEKRLRGPS